MRRLKYTKTLTCGVIFEEDDCNKFSNGEFIDRVSSVRTWLTNNVGGENVDWSMSIYQWGTYKWRPRRQISIYFLREEDMDLLALKLLFS